MATYYIAPWGDDLDAGSLAAPRRSLFAARDLVSPGDTVYLLPGVYSYAGLDVGAGNGDENDEWRSVSGSSPDRILITALVPFAAILDFTGAAFSTETRAGIRVHNTSYVTFSNFRIRNSPGRFVNVSGTSTNIIFESMFFDHSYEAGIALGCEDGIVRNSYIAASGLINEDYALEGAPGGGGWPIAVRTSTAVVDGSADNAVWDRVHVARFWGEGGGVGQGDNSHWTDCTFSNNWSVTGGYMNATDGPQLAERCHARMTLGRFNRSLIGSTGGQYGFAFATEGEDDPEISNCNLVNCTVDGVPMVEFDGFDYGFRSAFRHSHYQPQLDRSYRNLVVDSARIGKGCRYGLMVDEIPVGVTNRPANCDFVNNTIFQPIAQTYYDIDTDEIAWDLSGNTVTVLS